MSLFTLFIKYVMFFKLNKNPSKVKNFCLLLPLSAPARGPLALQQLPFSCPPLQNCRKKKVVAKST